ncbi:MAG: urea ABC transporter permease subunit UrtB [Dehalococcoidia bacterium]|nr:urea ABC transporter permease subunit UrtB [Dehalococcoidia bacterium]MSQ16505.1 urea ABC transporter permease subunit UrtB [Dehalococcoidia bacterium]
MDVWALQIFNGVSLSTILLLIALGLALSFGLMNVINLAHGEFIMIGAYTVYALQQAAIAFTGGPMADWTFIVALPLVFLIAALMGLLVERTVIRFLYRRPLDTLLATWGAALILQQLARSIFGAPNVQVVAPLWLGGNLDLGGDLVLPFKRLFIIAVALVCLAGIYWYMYRSNEGRRMRAVMQNRDMAASLGVSTRRVDSLTFALGAGLAGVAGWALTLIGPIGPSLGTFYVVDAFIVVILGGMGQIPGTILAAFIIGMFNTIFEYGTTAVVGKVLVFTLVILFLQWRPAGLMRLRSR